jgi:GT2 family glycosyltransferase
LIGYDLDLSKDAEMNGCSRNDLLTFLQAMGEKDIVEAPKYFGGELLVANGEALNDIYELIERIWKLNMQNFQSGKKTLKTEEHVISVALALRAECVGNGNAIIKRMWTRPSHRNVSSEDRRYSIWHLPAEKRFALHNLFSLTEKDLGSLANLSDNEFRDLVAGSIRLEPSVIDRVIYTVYPPLKNVLKRSRLTAPLSNAQRSISGLLASYPGSLQAHKLPPHARMTLRTAVVIATKDRSEVVARLLDQLAQQTVQPDLVIVSACDRRDVDQTRIKAQNIQVLFGPPGLSAQRNRALELVRAKYDILVFFDDDFIPSRFWIERVRMLLATRPDVACVTGKVLADGVRTGGFSWDHGQSIVDSADASEQAVTTTDFAIEEGKSPYGCNMAFRAKTIEGLSFDERLVLSGWLEDREFGSRVAHKGRMISTDSIWGVHLGTNGGRASGLKFGYSQIVNPWYLMKKESMSPLETVGYILRGLSRNALGIIFQSSTIDRRGRLKGNLIGLKDIITGRWAPERINEL